MMGLYNGNIMENSGILLVFGFAKGVEDSPRDDENGVSVLAMFSQQGGKVWCSDLPCGYIPIHISISKKYGHIIFEKALNFE